MKSPGWMNKLDIFPIKHIPIQTPLSISGSARTLVALDLELSAFCLVTHKASTEPLHPSLFAATILSSSHDLHLLSYLSFSIVLLHGGSGSSSLSSAFRCPGKGYVTFNVVVFSKDMAYDFPLSVFLSWLNGLMFDNNFLCYHFILPFDLENLS